MTRVAYIWIIALTVFAFWFGTTERARVDQKIEEATKEALHFGIKRGCERDNSLHYKQRNCMAEADETIRVYLRSRR